MGQTIARMRSGAESDCDATMSALACRVKSSLTFACKIAIPRRPTTGMDGSRGDGSVPICNADLIQSVNDIASSVQAFHRCLQMGIDNDLAVAITICA